ncbi:MAG: type II toxin-antitoxin system PemK/MazF family toxin [Acidobacteria bacterium]|nr:type II toxin-antitoxin system PemK/MazF family toxin [Acidobacteriota bacterium]
MPWQGEVFWVDLGEPVGSAPGHRHPCVVIQSDALNRSGIRTVVICMITSNVKQGSIRGNVPLERKEGGLAKLSVVNVSQLYTVDRLQLAKRIGKLSKRRVAQILSGVHKVIDQVDLDWMIQ